MDFTKSLELAIKIPVRAGDVPNRCHACSKGVGMAARWAQTSKVCGKGLRCSLFMHRKTIFVKTQKNWGHLDSGRAVAAGARLARVVRGQNRRGRAAPRRACVLLYLPS